MWGLGLPIGFVVAALVGVPIFLIRNSRRYHNRYHLRYSELMCDHCQLRRKQGADRGGAEALADANPGRSSPAGDWLSWPPRARTDPASKLSAPALSRVAAPGVRSIGGRGMSSVVPLLGGFHHGRAELALQPWHFGGCEVGYEGAVVDGERFVFSQECKGDFAAVCDADGQAGSVAVQVGDREEADVVDLGCAVEHAVTPINDDW